jgi:beta-phosphoglucomutase-like phosphatase (HAD superfamily)
MSDDKQPQGTIETETFTKEQVEERINQKLNHVLGQLKDSNAKLAEYESKHSEFQKQAEEAERKKLEEDGKLKELLEKTEKDKNEVITSLTSQVSALEGQLTTTQLKHLFAANGVNDEVKQLGYITMYNGITEDRPAPGEWIEKLKTENPDAFKAPVAVSGSTSFGSVQQHTKEPPKNALEEKREALREALQRR